ncbi:MAG: aminotransferase class V-fold PLP-dependent enzyme [Acidobacteria bacterium]|nr:aminotransferase class V-fold PLP-dependent enzyme [Acidobacteriota bacterium]
MRLDRRQFLSTCAAGAAYPHRAVATRGIGAEQSPWWPSTFPALRQLTHGHQLTYLDSAATTLRPQSVIDAVTSFYSTDNANPSPVHTLAARAAPSERGASDGGQVHQRD